MAGSQHIAEKIQGTCHLFMNSPRRLQLKEDARRLKGEEDREAPIHRGHQIRNNATQATTSIRRRGDTGVVTETPENSCSFFSSSSPPPLPPLFPLLAPLFSFLSHYGEVYAPAILILYSYSSP